MTVDTPIEFKKMAEITLELLKNYAKASGDHNPIHQDEKVAKENGLPGVIAHGMLIAGFVAARAREVQNKDLDSTWKLKRFQSRFKAMTLVGETVLVGGRVKKVEENQITLELKAQNSQGEVKTQSIVQFEQLV